MPFERDLRRPFANPAQRPGRVPADQRLGVGKQMAQRGNGSGIAPVPAATQALRTRPRRLPAGWPYRGSVP